MSMLVPVRLTASIGQNWAHRETKKDTWKEGNGGRIYLALLLIVHGLSKADNAPR
jgi:hypothetical protein